MYLTEIRIFNTMLKAFSAETLNIIYEYQGKVCYRCQTEDNSMNALCLNCSSALYCNKKCMRKNRILHENLCRYYMTNRAAVNNFMKSLSDNFKSYREQMFRTECRRNKDKFLLPGAAGKK